MSGEDDRTVWVGSLHDKVSEELLYELFLQAGPLSYVRRPKDKASGRIKNFAFVAYQHACSVPYAIALMNGISLFQQNIRVQSRHLQELQARGLASRDPGGVHSLDPFSNDDLHQEEPQEHYHHGEPQEHYQEAPSLLGQPPALLGNFGNIPPHILALAQQQMNLLNSNMAVPLSQNPSLNARLTPRSDRYGSLNFNSGNSSVGEQSQRYNRYQDNVNRMRNFDNKSMQAMKRRTENAMTEHNSEMLANLQDRQGRFDRMGPGDNRSNRNYDNYSRQRDNSAGGRYGSRDNSPYDGRYHNSHEGRHIHDHDSHQRQSNRNYRQQPYDRHDSYHNRNSDRYESHHSRNHNRHDSHQSRNHDRHGSHDSRPRHNERSSGNRGYSNDRHNYSSHSRR